MIAVALRCGTAVPSPVPELPEVETLRRSLEPFLLGRRIVSARIHRRDVLILPGDPPGGFSRSRSRKKPAKATPAHLLAGARIARLDRRGKQLALVTQDCQALIVHLGMTGQVLVDAEPRPTHAHISWVLDNGRTLLFRDPRRFGSLCFVPDFSPAAWLDLGPDALDIAGSDLHRRAARARRAIKAVLLDQSVLAGVGNIYADEALFLSGTRPGRQAATLNKSEWNALAAAIRRVLADAIEARGSTLRDYRDAKGIAGAAQLRHRVYGRAGEPCITCGKLLCCATIAQRTTVFCPTCQTRTRTRIPTSFPQS